MLMTLRIKNLALVEQIRVEFKPGLNIITGETGAGKSILMGALGLLMGGRADKGLVRAGEDACGAEALFYLEDSTEIDAILEEYGVEPCEDGELVIRRIIKASGPNQNVVNDCPVTAQALKHIGDALVDMHGPHDHQSLLHQECQRDILDAFGHLARERQQCETAFNQWSGLCQQRDALLGGGENVAEQLDRLQFKVKEISDAALVPGEEEEVQKEHEVLGNAQRIQELASGVLWNLVDGDHAVFDGLVNARPALEELSRLFPNGTAWLEEMDQLVRSLQELDIDIRRSCEDIESSPERLEWLDNRLSIYHRMKRKYGPGVEDVLRTLEEAQQALGDLESREERLAQLAADIEKALGRFNEVAGDLRRKRQAAAAKLASAIKKELKALGLRNGTFEVAFEEKPPARSGADEVDYIFAPNVGEEAKPLRVIASSGEISRVMLAIKTVLAAHDRVPVLVFDEIDANVGGEIGSAVGQKLKDVAASHQVICITHLPQVAVFGTSHYAVEKYVKAGRTFTQVSALEGEGRVEEVARMLGGRDLTSVTLEHAREMLGN
ncbi:MAG: DNA repair protein RecN [Spartobacteria bacterium]|nr:DNA repair protein RecN [Spartobacteria bacterium]